MQKPPDYDPLQRQTKHTSSQRLQDFCVEHLVRITHPRLSGIITFDYYVYQPVYSGFKYAPARRVVSHKSRLAFSPRPRYTRGDKHVSII